MSVIFKTVKRPSDPRVENSPKRYYPQLITLGRSVDLKFIAQKIQDRSSLSVGDIKSTIHWRPEIPGWPKQYPHPTASRYGSTGWSRH